MPAIPETMTVARMHAVGEALKLEKVPVPTLGSNDVLIRVRACGIVPNLGNILANWTTWYPQMPLPPLPAIFGLDPAGEIAATGDLVHNLRPGDRVYVNPLRSCGSCRHCRRGDERSCRHAAFQGYFGFSPFALQTFGDYTTGGLGEYMVAPASAIVSLPDNMSYDHAARLGYMGTAYSALCKSGAGVSDTVLVNGISGTLGIGCAVFGLAMGIRKILGTARDKALLEDIRALAPHRIEVHSIKDGPVDEWARSHTVDGEGVDAFIDCNGPGAAHESFIQGMRALRRGGTAVDIGALTGDVPMDLHFMMDNNQTFIGSQWFTTEEGQQMADMVGAGVADFSCLETHAVPLADVNAAISGIAGRHGGFSNFVIHP
ncbi:alcohol dehydrogenase catalytic domain-containing protein [Roseinatronobacter alkalisoli]|uniref:Alcohol dehydrogenase catalytic domain-containing protein n=1 Tax=Roseinatronobacter alkalisoli TaxID=3028235 RepID=A0ABT5TFZ4_9RHOB|nr:alcohol dehydrogenase catalytic domain-containing protein [Roseinatronobacter sp. HJB301]MDD7972843.1 alcohol dehydrogenase catalytic domain-containing protein [Roseinatronobacter sp. HJB301]